MSRKGEEAENGAKEQGEGEKGVEDREGERSSLHYTAHFRQSSRCLIPENSLLNGQPAGLGGLHIVIKKEMCTSSTWLSLL